MPNGLQTMQLKSASDCDYLGNRDRYSLHYV